jgi:DNA polymerase-1
MPNTPEIYLIDGSGYIYRAYHAIRGLSNSKGQPTNAVFGFTRMLLKLIEDRQPENLIICFDAKGPTFRHEMFPAYKANRPPMPEDLAFQIPHIKAVTRAFNLPVSEMAGFEADDLIGTYARMAEEQGFRVVMVTGDKDFMQLVTDQATIWDPMHDKTIDTKSIRQTFGLAPHQMVDVMGLSGDTSDNIPGVPGIGPKTAQSLIQQFGSMDAVYQNIATITKKKQKANLIEHEAQARLSRALVEINLEAPLVFDPEVCKRRPPDTEALLSIFKDLEFKQLQQMFSQPTPQREKRYHAIYDQDTLRAVAARLEAAELMALDTETTAIDPMRARLVGISVALEPDEAFYIPCGHDYPDAPRQLSLAEVLAHLGPVLANPAIGKVGQNIKYDGIILQRHGADLAGVRFDTMLASYLINPSKRSHSLDQIAMDLFGHKTITYQEVAGKGAKATGFNAVPLDKATPYACEDADITLMAYRVLAPEIERLGLAELMQDVELPLIPVLMNMEMRGVAVDRGRLKALSKSFAQQLEALETQIYALAGEPFNVNSPQQLGKILFEKLKLPVVKRTRKKTAYSTDVGVLTTLAEQHELPALILRHRTLAKLKSTYADALIDLVNPQSGRIHSSFNQTVAATGRLSSSDPNLQNIPIRTDEGREIRRAFVPQKDWLLVSADYSQIELRILAHYSDDAILIESFEADEDVHTRTATEIFNVFPQMITADLRRQAKVINFGIIYGMSPFGLSKALGISQKMAKTYIDHYFARYQGVKAFIDQTIAAARDSGQTSTLLGRIRQVPDINSTNHNVRQAAERTAINTPIQGSAADLIKVAMINVARDIAQQQMRTAMLLSVHDELIFEVPPEEVDTAEKLIRKAMEGVWDLKVPLKVNLSRGQNWAEAH